MRNKPIKIEKISFTLDNWRTYPFSQFAFSNVKKIIPTAIISKGTKESSFNLDIQDLNSLIFENKYNEKSSLSTFLENNLADNFVVIQKGKKVFEWFKYSELKNNQHILFSVSKSLTSLLTGMLIQDNFIKESKKISFYIPEIKESAYKNATIRNLLDMTVASDFSEDYLDRTGLFNLYREATGFNPRHSGSTIGLNEFLTKMPQSVKSHGEYYQYCSPNTDLLGWIIERVTKEKFSNVFSNYIFQKCEPKNEAYITLDPKGAPRTAGGICMTIDDLSKLAEMVRCKGSLGNKQIIPENLMVELIDYENKFPWISKEKGILFPKGGYRSKWYQTGLQNKEICAIGIHGQWIWIDPVRKISILLFSSRKKPLSPSYGKNFSLLCRELCNQVSS